MGCMHDSAPHVGDYDILHRVTECKIIPKNAKLLSHQLINTVVTPTQQKLYVLLSLTKLIYTVLQAVFWPWINKLFQYSSLDILNKLVSKANGQTHIKSINKV